MKILDVAAVVDLLVSFVIMAAPVAASPGEAISYHRSWRAGDKDVHRNTMYGTEIVRLVPYQGKLYASTSLWTESDPSIPKASQLLELDSPDANWKLMHQFTTRNLRLTCLQSVTFTTDGTGNKIPPVELLLTAPDQIGGGAVTIYSLDPSSNALAPMTLGTTSDKYSQIRAIGSHHDSVTGVDYVFAGSTALGIYRGVYDARAAGRISWQASEFALPGGERVMAFANCNEVLYTATSKHILKRTDGASPAWIPVKEYPNEIAASGIRGLTAVPNPSGRGQVLLYTCRGSDRQSCVRRLDPSNGYAETVELNLNADLGRRLGVRIPYVLSAYNDFLNYTLPDTGEKVWMFGVEISLAPPAVRRHPEWRVVRIESQYLKGMASSDAYYAAEGRYYVRHFQAGVVSYELKEITDPALPTLVSVRTIAASPFPADQDKVLYFGGYDANFEPAHNTGWIYRGVLQPHKGS